MSLPGMHAEESFRPPSSLSTSTGWRAITLGGIYVCAGINTVILPAVALQRR